MTGGERRLKRNRHGAVLAAALGAAMPFAAYASDHGDAQRLLEAGRHDARTGDFYIFTRGKNLVLVLTIVGALPEPTNDFRFGSDVVYRFLIDREAAVAFDNAEDVRLHGGAIVDPSAIREDVVVEMRFSADGVKRVMRVNGLHPGPEAASFFSGLRDDPFIRSVVIGKNLAAIVVELPLRRVVAQSEGSVLLAWASTDVVGVDGDPDDLTGRAYRSTDAPGLNALHPSLHVSALGERPDVVIFDTSEPALFPNGRDLTDDVVTLLGRQVPGTHPTTNDVPFLDSFPYLAPPHPRPALDP